MHENYLGKGLSGLKNLGNTCYMNSIIQILSHTYEFTECMIKKDFNGKYFAKDKYDLLKEWSKLLKQIWQKNEIQTPTDFLTEFQKFATTHQYENFTGYQQNDASEFLIIFIDYLHECLSREVEMNIVGSIKSSKDDLAKICYEKIKNMYSKKYSEVLKIFYGINVTNIKSISSQEMLSRNAEPFFILNLPIPSEKKEVTIMDCMKKYLEEDQLDYTNEKTNRQESCVKYFEFWNFPEILIISFNRFNYQNRKNHKTIYFPFDSFDLNGLVKGYNNEKEFVYDLYAICLHSGSALGGHYTSVVKNANGKWYHFNDSLVSEMNINIHNLYSKAYVLFYRKKKT